jgi:hypothetical protein
MPWGNERSEATLQYELHATMRMKAKREDMYASDAKVKQEDIPKEATPDYTRWRTEKIKTHLADNIDAHATDHSTIMTNAMHAEKALAYDVAIGVCDLTPEDWTYLRRVADWRLANVDDSSDPHFKLWDYFNTGMINTASALDWSRSASDAQMPPLIVDERDDSVVLKAGVIL